jgi:excisionase family DNA binding protein
MEEYFTIDEVMEKIKVSRQTVYNWMNSGKLKYLKIGKLVRIKEEDLKRFIEGKNK